jgi:hypothetical protein
MRLKYLMTKETEIIEKGTHLYQNTKKDVAKGGDSRILVITDQAKDRCTRYFDTEDTIKLCEQGVTEAMTVDLKKAFRKKHPK